MVQSFTVVIELVLQDKNRLESDFCLSESKLYVE
jgi:hypothetical protein